VFLNHITESFKLFRGATLTKSALTILLWTYSTVIESEFVSDYTQLVKTVGRTLLVFLIPILTRRDFIETTLREEIFADGRVKMCQIRGI